MTPPASSRFTPLDQAAFRDLEQAPSLKGLLRPFKGKGDLSDWASECHGLRDELIALSEREVLAQANHYPFTLLPVQLAQQTTGAGTTFLRWRKPDRSAMGVGLWQALVSSSATPAHLIDDLYAIELQRIVLNMQISLLHTLGRQAQECANKVAHADTTYQRRIQGHPVLSQPTSEESL